MEATDTATEVRKATRTSLFVDFEECSCLQTGVALSSIGRLVPFADCWTSHTGSIVTSSIPTQVEGPSCVSYLEYQSVI